MVVVILNSSSLSQIVQQTTILINEKNFKYFLVVIKVLAKVEGLDTGIKTEIKINLNFILACEYKAYYKDYFANPTSEQWKGNYSYQTLRSVHAIFWCWVSLVIAC